MNPARVEVLREENRAAGVVEIDLAFRGSWDYSAERWASTPHAHRGGCASGRYPFALLIGGRVFLHNAVVEALYVGVEAGEVRYGAGRNAARYEPVSEDTLLSLATRVPCGRSERELAKDRGIAAAFSALVESL